MYVQSYHLLVFDPDQSAQCDIINHWIAELGYVMSAYTNMEILCPVKVGSAKAPDAKPNYDQSPTGIRLAMIGLRLLNHSNSPLGDAKCWNMKAYIHDTGLLQIPP